jgi:putative ABC transport system permease protein
MAIVPWTTPVSRLIQPKGDLQSMIVQGSSREEMQDGIENAREAMRGSRHLAPGRPDNFALETEDSALAFFDGLKRQMIVFGTALPAIGLVVGAMVIMNIMLVAVAERTREIGVRKALGATRRDILLQFLIEAATLTGIGGVLGILVGLTVGRGVTALMNIEAKTPVGLTLLAVAVSVAIGLIFGVIPARRAARMDPVEALRYE